MQAVPQLDENDQITRRPFLEERKDGEPIKVLCMATHTSEVDFKPFETARRPMGPDDVVIDMVYCGVCHTDLHVAANHLQGVRPTHYPCVPGHELAGVASAVGSNVTRVSVGDHVGVGCMVDSCLKCKACLRGEQQLCSKGSVGTYNGQDKYGRAKSYPEGGHTLGGYTTRQVVNENFCIIIPKDYPLECAGPVQCAGVTMYDPLKRYGAKEGIRVGIVGLGGLGMMGVQIAHALGCQVTAISRQKSKSEATTQAGASVFILSTDPNAMKAGAGSLDLLLNTVPAEHDYKAYNRLLGKGGKQIILGIHSGFVAAMVVNKLVCNSKVKTSSIGGVQATQEVMNLCAKHKIYPTCKVIPVEQINQAYEALEESNKAGIRFVIDISTLNASAKARCEDQAPPALGPSQSGMGKCSILGAVCALLCSCKWC